MEPMHPVRDLPARPAAPATGYAAPTAVGNAASCLRWGWWLVGGACVLGVLPFVGMLAWFLGPPLILAGIVLSVIAMSQGRAGGGVALLLFSIIVAPVVTVFAPIISAFLFSSLS